MICPNCNSKLSASAALCECGWVINDAVQGAEVTDFDWEGPRQDEAQEKKSVGIVLALAAIIVGIVIPLIIIPSYVIDTKTDETGAVWLSVNTIFAIIGIVLGILAGKQDKKAGGKGRFATLVIVICSLWIVVGPGVITLIYLSTVL